MSGYRFEGPKGVAFVHRVKGADGSWYWWAASRNESAALPGDPVFDRPEHAEYEAESLAGLNRCEGCGAEESCAYFEDPYGPPETGRGPFCYDCWHQARERTPAYAVERHDGWRPPGDVAYMRHEAEARAAKLTAEYEERRRVYGEDYVTTYSAVPRGSWAGERLTHPGYMRRRRGAIMAAHPELAQLKSEAKP